MNRETKKVTLNRAVFSLRPLESNALTVLTTLLHHFPEPGVYELFVRRGGQVIHRGPIHVIGEKRSDPADDRPGQAPYQLNIDLATLGRSSSEGCACQSEERYVLNTGGVIGFYVSAGTGRYTVTISQIAADKKAMLLDSTEALPPGDFFAVTLVRPGIYTVTNRLADSQMKVQVRLPRRGEAYRPDNANLIQAELGRFTPDSASIFAGQSLLFQAAVPSQLVVELVQADPAVTDRPTSSGERPRRTIRKRGTTPHPHN